jgi:hypothetical protein
MFLKSSNYLVSWNSKEGWCGSDEVVAAAVVSSIYIICLHGTLIAFISA